jgi:AraC family transcriptional regulator
MPRPETFIAHDVAIAKVIHRMKSDLVGWQTDLSLSSLARESCYSRSHLIEIFEHLTGTTPHHFLASLRIQRAKNLLLTTSATATAISLDVGYQSFGTFSRTFANLVGIPPQSYRLASRQMSGYDLARAASAFIERNAPTSQQPALTGNVRGPSNEDGFVFIGAFSRGVPQGRPMSGTVLLKPGPFRFKQPSLPSFHLLAALIKIPDTQMFDPLAICPTLVASQKVTGPGCEPICLDLRPVTSRDPPVVVALTALLH